MYAVLWRYDPYFEHRTQLRDTVYSYSGYAAEKWKGCQVQLSVNGENRWLFEGDRGLFILMPGNICLVCGHTRVKDPNVSFHRFPGSSDQARREQWLCVFKLTGEQVKVHSRVFSRHFPGADPRNDPEMTIGKHFASPRKKDVPRAISVLKSGRLENS